ncbi:MAG: hypothetical protein ACLRI7_10095 [Ruthenibacterium lactatiformans]
MPKSNQTFCQKHIYKNNVYDKMVVKKGGGFAVRLCGINRARIWTGRLMLNQYGVDEIYEKMTGTSTQARA